jgi:hypothetical protein
VLSQIGKDSGSGVEAQFLKLEEQLEQPVETTTPTTTGKRLRNGLAAIERDRLLAHDEGG